VSRMAMRSTPPDSLATLLAAAEWSPAVQKARAALRVLSQRVAGHVPFNLWTAYVTARTDYLCALEEAALVCGLAASQLDTALFADDPKTEPDN
jgi:hypothetical protein